MDETIRLVHGNGGRFSHELMEKYYGGIIFHRISGQLKFWKVI